MKEYQCLEKRAQGGPRGSVESLSAAIRAGAALAAVCALTAIMRATAGLLRFDSPPFSGCSTGLLASRLRRSHNLSWYATDVIHSWLPRLLISQSPDTKAG
jgi:hypothetical protein